MIINLLLRKYSPIPTNYPLCSQLSEKVLDAIEQNSLLIELIPSCSQVVRYVLSKRDMFPCSAVFCPQ